MDLLIRKINGNSAFIVPYETYWRHAGQETLRKQFPVGKKHSGAASSRKPFANSFLPVRNATVPSRAGNHTRKASCRQETQWSHVEQETLRKQFPVGKKHNGATSSRKLYAKSFLSARNTVEPRRAGNLSQTVSCRQETQWSHAEQETFRKQFPAGKKHNGATSSRKPFANSFLSARNTVEPSRVGNHTRKVSCRQETEWCHAE